ncbi:aldo/keto reductase [Streptomyces werraensis]|uniref:aldo/keto reductase n=1 Tax=Streptomyces werraensis TaxID=68284 RepID=UPI003F4D96E4
MRRAPGKPFDAHESRGGPLGGLFEAVDDDTAAGAQEAALDSGIRYFDTSPHYGIGQSERRIGALLRGRPRDGSPVPPYARTAATASSKAAPRRRAHMVP